MRILEEQGFSPLCFIELSKNMTDELFNSMVSVRDKRTNVGPHLGLGLFIAKLIAEFHGGIISATNLTEDEGVCFSIKI